jgi:hypothetical protein
MKTTLALSLPALALFSLAAFPKSACAVESAPSVATLAQTEGKAQLFTHPSKKPHAGSSVKEGTMAFFEGEYYLIQDAKVGNRVENGNIVRTLPGAQTKVIYDNGDQFYVGPGTAYRVSWNDKAKADNADKLDTKINLMYGRLRGVISKDGPRKKLQIRTRAATMGVRGTDFFIADNGPNGETEVSVLRGSVEVKPVNGSTQEIKTGMSASVTQKLEVRETTKEDLNGIQKASTLPVPQATPSAQIAELEKKAVNVTTQDIKTYQPEIYKQLAAELAQVSRAEQLNTKLIEIASVKAPSAPPKRRKPRITELKESDEGDLYDKYFKMEH